MSTGKPTRLILAALLCLALTGLARADVPTHMAVQGQLTDDTGTPLPAGVLDLTFKIFDAASGGTEIWSGESYAVQISEGGLWRARIGRINPLDPSVFADTSRYLEITVDDGVNPPEALQRIRFSTNPYAGHAKDAELLAGNQSSYYLDAGNLNVGTLSTDRYSALDDLISEGYLNDDADTDLLTRAQADERFVNAAGDTIVDELVIRNRPLASSGGYLEIMDEDGDKAFSAEGGPPWKHLTLWKENSGLATLSIFNDSYTELFLADGSSTSRAVLNSGTSASASYLALRDPFGTLRAQLHSGYTSGGRLRIYNGAGTNTIELHGDGNVTLPTGAISSLERLDEPGVSNHVNPNPWVFLNSGHGDYAADSVTIDIPTGGYVEVTAGCFLNMYHIGGTDTKVYLSIHRGRGWADFSYPGSQSYQVPAGVGSSTWQYGCTITRFYAETSAGAKKYYLNAEYNSGVSTNTNLGNTYIRAKFFPTLYGSVSVTESDDDGTAPGEGIPSDGTVSYVRPNLRVITVEEHNAQVAAEQERQRQLVEQQLAPQTAEIGQATLKENQP